MDTNAAKAKLQREQLEKYLNWVKDEGGIEGPGHLSTWFKPHQKVRLAWLKSNCIGQILELGCNYGYPLAFCNGHIGVDWNEKTISLARILNPDVEFIVSDIRNLPIPDGHVDTTLCTDVLEHLSWTDVKTAVDEAIRVSRHRILVTIPNGDNQTPESTSMKHQFLATTEKVGDIVNMFKPYSVHVTKDFYFVYIRVDKV